MILPTYFNSKTSLNLFNLKNDFKFLKNLYQKKKLPKVIMLSGKKGSGKSTLINHLMYFIFDKENYNDEINELKHNTLFHKQFIENIFPNIIYLSGSDFQYTKIDNIRNLKKKIFQTSISEYPRFIIFDNIELFNNNSLNALLKIIEEPSKNNYFVLIYNKSKPLLETIKSRCLDIKIILKEHDRLDIIELLKKKFNINLLIDIKKSQLTPGNLIKFNFIYNEYGLSDENDFLENIELLLNLYKKDKKMLYIDMSLYLADNYFNSLLRKNSFTNEKLIEYKRFVFDNINKFFLHNLNQNAVLNNINNIINVK
jgi:DNA polymerase III subunit delta'